MMEPLVSAAVPEEPIWCEQYDTSVICNIHLVINSSFMIQILIKVSR